MRAPIPQTTLLAAWLSLHAAAASPPPRAATPGPSLGVFEGGRAIGRLVPPGSVTYDAGSQTYLVAGSGTGPERDELYVVWKRLRGDFILTATAAFVGAAVDHRGRLGLIARSGLEPSAAYAAAAVRGDGQTSLQFRGAAGAETGDVRSPVNRPEVIQLARTGRTFAMSVARFGEPFPAESLVELELGDELFIGLFVSSHHEKVIEKALFRNVRIVVPAGADLVPYQDFLGSQLEILEVDSGHRTILYSTPDSLQAPNWTPDGRALIYNRNGLLYRFDLPQRAPRLLDTGFATQNNNDHVLSFDGSMLGISHHDPAQENRSIIYTLPVTGGNPIQITPTGPSYLHGWSPEGKYLVYTAERDGDYDIYRIPVAGGEEKRLTTAPGLDDGPEYSPDGRYIYFNSVRSGRMEIWRMLPDGSAPEQLTDDEFNNWFPHVAPDGESIVMLSYSGDVDPSDHPFYKEVYLRIMPAGGGRPKVVAYLYGGQGTINVPSWAPDGERLAFVSNTGEH